MVKIFALETIKQAVIPLVEKYDISKIDIFGSYAENNITNESDIDLLIEFRTDTPSIFKVMGFKEELQTSLNHSVDIITAPVSFKYGFTINKVVNIYEKQ